MIDIILALFLGYYYRKAEEKNKNQVEYEKTDNIEHRQVPFGYCKENETTEDLR